MINMLRDQSQGLSFRQQINLLMNITAGQQDLRKVSQDSIAELRDFIQDEEIRVRIK